MDEEIKVLLDTISETFPNTKLQELVTEGSIRNYSELLDALKTCSSEYNKVQKDIAEVLIAAIEGKLRN